jgi:hypothetical protein
MWQERGLVFCAALGTPLNPSKVVDRFKTLLSTIKQLFWDYLYLASRIYPTLAA